jgi:hypothetical protein
MHNAEFAKKMCITHKKYWQGLFQQFCKIVPDYLNPDAWILPNWRMQTNQSSFGFNWKKQDISDGKGIAQCFDHEYRWFMCRATDNILLSSTIGRNKTWLQAKFSAIINGTEELIRTRFLCDHPFNWWWNCWRRRYCSYYYRRLTVTARMKRSKVIDNATLKQEM